LAAPDDSPPPRRVVRRPSAPPPIELALGARIERADIPGLCDQAELRLKDATDSECLVCDVGAVRDPDAVTIDALARLQLTASRLDREVHLRRASRELLDLLEFMGLSEALPLFAWSGLETGRQAEQREEGGGIEEERDPADPAT
jgi:hypothetical protein